MDELKELVRIIADIGLKKVDSFNLLDVDSDMIAAFFYGLNNGEFVT